MSPLKEGTDSPHRLYARAKVNFKDLQLTEESDEDDELQGSSCQISEKWDESHDSTNKHEILQPELGRVSRRRPERNKLIIILVGLPGRGKTFLCNKLQHYLNWLGHTTNHFNVGRYRRLQNDGQGLQDASFFDRNNQAGLEARNKALNAALDDLLGYLYSDEGQVAIFDATNTTEERRQLLVSKFHGKFQYIFIESICNDPKVLERNYLFKLQYSPDYVGADKAEALDDFKARVKNYEEVYEPITNRNLHYIKLIDMITGRGYMDVNRISGYIPGKIVFFLMQVCKAGMATSQSRKIWLTRHGESEWNTIGMLGGNSSLSPKGEQYAQSLPDVLLDRLPVTFDDQAIPVAVWTSTLKRTIQTANYLPFPKLRWKALDEIHAGVCDGMTYEEISRVYPDEFEARQRNKLKYRYPSGESYLDVIQRLEPVIIEVERENDCVCIVGHQAVLRAIYGYFMAVPLDKIPVIDVPLHTLVELRPKPDGTMEVEMIPVSVVSPAGSPRPPPSHLRYANPPVQLPLGSMPSTQAEFLEAEFSEL